MYAKNTVVHNNTGLHARPAALFTQLAGRFQSRITIETGKGKVDAKSILKLLSLGISQGTSVTVTATGPDERQAVDSLVDLIDSRFSE
ncbi:MAG: Phosphotransferase system, phosphocarrier protein HPr [Sporomusa sp.]|jgi:phosphotransferase system HPr (HPr) family protein|nr:Phosphotransferase system, phosphocarrier protein HPr [Sporomusa sp.]